MLIGVDVSTAEDPQDVVLGAVSGGDDRLGLVDFLQNLGERLLLDLLAGSIKQKANVDVSSLPNPVLVSKVSIGDDSRRFEFDRASRRCLWPRGGAWAVRP